MRGSSPIALLSQHLFEELERAGIVGLAEPEHGLLAHLGVAVGLRHFYQFRHAFVLRQLAQRKNRFFLHVRVGIVFDGAGNCADRFLAGFLRQPEKRLAAHVRAGVVMRHSNHFLDRAGFMAHRQRKCNVRAHVRTRIGLAMCCKASSPVFPRAAPSQKAACLRSPSRWSGFTNDSNARSAAASAWSAMAVKAPWPKPWSPCSAKSAARTYASSNATLSASFTPVSQTNGSP